MSGTNELFILNGQQVRALLDLKNVDILDIVQRVYTSFALNQCTLPHSSFLNFPDSNNRIIGLPAYLNEEYHVAGIKWIASFPGNTSLGLERASASIILNSMHNGRPLAFLEGSTISAKRTAASAALAAKNLHQTDTITLGLIGCGPINYETLHFLQHVFREIKYIYLYDRNAAQAETFKERCSKKYPSCNVNIAHNIDELFESSTLVSLATTAPTPHIIALPPSSITETILNISLRDLDPGILLHHDNVVDDADHVCRENTSVHLAEKFVGNRDFIRCTLGDVLLDKDKKKDESKVTIFSPFGLGVLDIALAQYVYAKAREEGIGTIVSDFMPSSKG